IAVNGPLVVVEDNNETFGLFGDVVERLKGDAVGKGRIAGDGNDVLSAAGHVAGNSHAKRGGEGCTGVACAVAVVLALRAEHEAVKSARLADGGELLAPAGEDFMCVDLVTDVEEELVLGRGEDVVHGQRQLDDAEIGP